MLNGERLKELNASAELLVAQADLYRGLLRVDGASLEHRLGWLNRASATIRPVSPWLLGGAVAAGLIAMRGWSRAVRWLPAALSAWRLARTFLGRSG